MLFEADLVYCSILGDRRLYKQDKIHLYYIISSVMILSSSRMNISFNWKIFPIYLIGLNKFMIPGWHPYWIYYFYLIPY